MNAIVAMALDSCLNVATYVWTNLPGLTRSTNAARIAAMKHALPDALSQFSSNSAPYGAGAFVTGGICVIWLCRPGTISRVALRAVSGTVGHDIGIRLSAKWLIFGLIDASPTSSTQITSSTYGLHAMKISLPECFFSVSDAG